MKIKATMKFTHQINKVLFNIIILLCVGEGAAKETYVIRV